MSKSNTFKPLAAAIGATFIVSLASSPIANAAANPFGLQELSGGFMVADQDIKCGSTCGGAAPTFDEKGEMKKCGSTCGEVVKCGELCGGNPAALTKGKGDEVVKCGELCAAVKSR